MEWKITLSRSSSQRNECDIIADDRSELRMSFLFSSIRSEGKMVERHAIADYTSLILAFLIGIRYGQWAMADHAYVSFYLYLFPHSAEKKVHRQRAILRSGGACVSAHNVHGAQIGIDFRFIVVCISVATGHRKCFFYVLLDANIKKKPC